jgi:hypothetical protein
MTDGETGDRSLWVTPPMETFRYDRPDLRFRVGLPAPVDLALYSFGDAAFSEAMILDACTAATAREVTGSANSQRLLTMSSSRSKQGSG